MAPKVTGKSNQTSVNTTTRKAVTKKKEIDIAKEMMKFADDNTAAIGKEGFKSLLKQVNKSNIIDVIKSYDKISPDKSIIGMILSEIGSNDESMETALIGEGNGKTTVRGLFTLLCDKAKNVGVDSDTIANFESEFDEELDKQLGNDGFFSQIRSLVSTDSNRLDTIMRALVQTIDNQTTLSQTDKQTIAATPATKLQADTNNIIGKRYNQALKDFNEQLARDGWAGDVADFWGKRFSENNADAVRADLKTCKKQHDELVAARKQGDEAYKAKFKEIFGVAYHPTNIVAYQKAESRYIEASRTKAQEDNFKTQFSVLLNSNKLQEEGTNIILSPTTGGGYYVITASKQQVFDREYKRFAKLLGPQGEAVIKEKFKEAGVENKSIDDKFKVLQTLANAINTSLHKSTMKATGGVSYETIERQKDNCYKAAFGLDNDIMKRVTDYNISQQRGAGVVKGATVMAIVTACALTGQVEGIVAVAGVATGATATVEITDAASQKRNLDALRKDGLGAYLKSVGKNTDWGGIAKASLSSGAMMVAIGGVSYPIANLCRISASAAGLTGKALDIATCLGTNAVVTSGVLGSQYLMKGEITTEDAVFAVVMAVVGSTIQVLQINKAYAKAESAAVDAHVQNIQDARRTLGFEDGVEITPEMLKQQYRKMALANHPDHGGSNVNMAVINSAKEYLQAHLADINIGLTGAKPQTINPTVETARGNTTTKQIATNTTENVPATLPTLPESTISNLTATNQNYVAQENALMLAQNGYQITQFTGTQFVGHPSVHSYATQIQVKNTQTGKVENIVIDHNTNAKPSMTQITQDITNEQQQLNIKLVTTTENTPTVRSAESSSYAQHLEQTFGNNPKYEIVVKRCNEIKEQFGVEVQFNGLPDGDVGASVTEIYNELQNFKMHNADGSKKLVTVNITDENQTYWDGNNNSINIGTNGKLNVNDVRAALRHELVHDYDTKPELGNEFPTTFDKNNIEPYIQEMLNAGLSPEEIIYAFGNRKELLSVVAMCDMSKLSEGFKTILKDAGMPENVLNMKTNNAVSQNTYTPQQVRTNTQTITNAIVQKGGVGYAPSTNGQYKNLYSAVVMLDLIAKSYENEYGLNRTSSKNKTKTNETNKPRHTYASEMALERLNSELFGTEIKIDGNKVTIKNQSLRGNSEQTVEIPEEYFEGCETDKDREYLVKHWLVESRHDYKIENIPYELLKAADDTHFYYVDNHRMYMDYDTKLREAGIKIGKFEKSNEFRKPNIINFEVNGKKYRMETFAEKKSDIILGASSNFGSPFNNYPFANVIKNIIDSSSGKFVREGSYETFTPKLHVGVPTLKNKSIINHGTAHESAYTNQSAMYKLSKEVVGHFDEENVKEIIYIEDSSSPERKQAYSYYDDVNDDQYLYLFDERKMLKQDSDGNIYQKQIENYEDFPWVKVNEY